MPLKIKSGDQNWNIKEKLSWDEDENWKYEQFPTESVSLN
jgi:hypothetical protein